jgi:hypothetical protein
VVQEPLVLTEPATVKSTTEPETGLPAEFSTVAVTAWLVPTGLTASGGDTVTEAGPSGTTGWDE